MAEFKYLHTMIRVKDLDKSLDFYTRLLGMQELRKRTSQRETSRWPLSVMVTKLTTLLSNSLTIGAKKNRTIWVTALGT